MGVGDEEGKREEKGGSFDLMKCDYMFDRKPITDINKALKYILNCYLMTNNTRDLLYFMLMVQLLVINKH